MSDPPTDRDREGDAARKQPADESSGAPPEVTSGELLGSGRELLIRHGEELYRLRITRNGKLILQK